MKRKIAVFDFDGTLFDGDSFISFSLFSKGKSKFFTAIIKNIHYLIAWKLKLISNEKAKQKLFYSLFSGTLYDSFKKDGMNFGEVINKKLKDETYAKLQKHLNNGDKILIITASFKEWIKPWALNSGIDNVLSTEPEIKDGKLTGFFSTPNCYGEEKVRRLLEEEPDRKEYTLYVYGDSKGDSAIMNISDEFELIR